MNLCCLLRIADGYFNVSALKQVVRVAVHALSNHCTTYLYVARQYTAKRKEGFGTPRRYPGARKNQSSQGCRPKRYAPHALVKRMAWHIAIRMNYPRNLIIARGLFHCQRQGLLPAM